MSLPRQPRSESFHNEESWLWKTVLKAVLNTRYLQTTFFITIKKIKDYIFIFSSKSCYFTHEQISTMSVRDGLFSFILLHREWVNTLMTEKLLPQELTWHFEGKWRSVCQDRHQAHNNSVGKILVHNKEEKNLVLSHSGRWVHLDSINNVSPWLRNSSILSLKGCRFSSKDSLQTFSVSAEHAEKRASDGTHLDQSEHSKVVQGQELLASILCVKRSVCSPKKWGRNGGEKKASNDVDVWLSCVHIYIITIIMSWSLIL